MDEKKLADSFINDPSRKSPEDRRREELLEEAQRINEEFPRTADRDEQQKLKTRYREIDRELEALKPGNSHLAMKAYGREDTRPEGVRKHEEFLERIEKGRKRVIEKGPMGASHNTHTRIKSELNYLLNSYTPTNDWRIEMLIDKWRMSGDPAYDPSIKIKYRNVRKGKAKKDNAL